MAFGTGTILHVSTLVAPNDYAYTWRTDANAVGEVANNVTGITLTAAFTAIGGLALALPGSVQRGNIRAVIGGVEAQGQIMATVGHGPYAYEWRVDSSLAGATDVLNGKSLAVSYNDIQGLIIALGLPKRAQIDVTSQ